MVTPVFGSACVMVQCLPVRNLNRPPEAGISPTLPGTPTRIQVPRRFFASGDCSLAGAGLSCAWRLAAAEKRSASTLIPTTWRILRFMLIVFMIVLQMRCWDLLDGAGKRAGYGVNTFAGYLRRRSAVHQRMSADLTPGLSGKQPVNRIYFAKF